MHLHSFERLIDDLTEYNDVCKCSICQIDLYENRLKCQYMRHLGLCLRKGTDVTDTLFRHLLSELQSLSYL